jgi:hypothetical protein
MICFGILPVYIIWHIWYRDRYRFGVVWFYASLIGSTATGHGLPMTLFGMTRFLFLGIGWIVRKISKERFSVFQVSRACWGITAVIVSIIVCLNWPPSHP